MGLLDEPVHRLFPRREGANDPAGDLHHGRVHHALDGGQADDRARGTTVAREVRGGAATFLTMAYILFANPGILATAGVPFRPVVAATAVAVTGVSAE